MSENKNIGNYGEGLALDFLKNKNHKILARNFRASRGEIDIISKIDDIIVFTEVKTRYNKNFGFAIESINLSKIRTIKLIASKYIHFKRLYNFNVRFDVIEIYLNYHDDSFNLNYIENAF